MQTIQKKYKLSKGEVREELLERQDLSILESSASRIENMIATPFGGAKTRDGTLNIAVASQNMQEIIEPTITTDPTVANPEYLYDTTNMFTSGNIAAVTDLVLYDWNLVYIFEEDFDGTDANPYPSVNGWTEVGSNSRWQRIANKLVAYGAPGVGVGAELVRSLEGYSSTNLPITIEFTLQAPSTGGIWTRLGVRVGNNGTSDTSGTGIDVFSDEGSSASKVYVISNNSIIDTTAVSGINNDYKYKVEVSSTETKWKYWPVAGSEPASWNVEVATTFDNDGAYLMLWSSAFNSGGPSYLRVDDLSITGKNG